MTAVLALVNLLGEVPVISGRGTKESYLGHVSEEWLKKEKIPIYTKLLIVVAANGNVGSMFLRDEQKYAVHDDAIGIEVKNELLDPAYVLYALLASVALARFQYDAKLYQKRLSKLKIKVPIADDGIISKERQQTLARKFEGLEKLKQQVEQLAKNMENKIIVTD